MLVYADAAPAAGGSADSDVPGLGFSTAIAARLSVCDSDDPALHSVGVDKSTTLKLD